MRSIGNLSLLALSLGIGNASAQSFCDPELGDLCFQERTSQSGVTYRIAIPTGAAEGFQAILQIVAPLEVGWAGLAWSSSMTNGPLTVGWANGDDTVVTGRKTEVYIYPEVDPGQTLSLLPTASTTNETHWKATVLCDGCSLFTNNAGAEVALDPAATAVPFGWATAADAPDTPADPESTFGAHSATGYFAFSLLDAQAEGFEEVIGASL